MRSLYYTAIILLCVNVQISQAIKAIRLRHNIIIESENLFTSFQHIAPSHDTILIYTKYFVACLLALSTHYRFLRHTVTTKGKISLCKHKGIKVLDKPCLLCRFVCKTLLSPPFFDNTYEITSYRKLTALYIILSPNDFFVPCKHNLSLFVEASLYLLIILHVTYLNMRCRITFFVYISSVLIKH